LKLAVYGPSNRLGLVIGDYIADMQYATALYLTKRGVKKSAAEEKADSLVGHELGAFIRGEDRALKTANKVLDYSAKNLAALKKQKIVQTVARAKLRPPVTQDYRFKVMCIGANFADHLVGMYDHFMGKKYTIDEAKRHALEERQWGFYKLGSNIIGQDDPVPYPARTERLDYEGEVALVIGKGGKDIRASELMDHVFGFTLFDDFSARDTQEAQIGGLMFSKNFAGSGALGPVIVTKDELANPHNIEFTLSVNGQRRQNGNTKDMIRGFDNWIEHFSRDMVLNPGDVIASGTCAGTAADSSEYNPDKTSKPERFLKVGDLVEVSSPRIGTLRNRIVAK
jgi:2-keto-4-pentenoate hydratase/2-oxohepta-3-ene-1,7-dioic acid hydratase in catechol pathway